MLISYSEYKTMTGDEKRDRKMVEAAIEAASEVIEKYCRRRFEEDSYTEELYFDTPTNLTTLKAYPVTEITEIYGAEIMHLDKANGIARFKRPVRGAVTIRYTGGMGAVPSSVKQAAAILAMSGMTAIENNGQTVTSERLADYSASYKDDAGQIPGAAVRLLAAYKG